MKSVPQVTGIILGVLLAHAALAAAEAAGTFEDPAYGFKISVPSLGDSTGAVNVQRLVVAAPARDGFAVNCNVQVQFIDLGLDSFLELSFRQFAALGLKVLDQSRKTVSGRPAAAFEYRGQMENLDLQFAAVAIAGQGRIWLATCSALAPKFEEYRAVFAQTLESFAVTTEDASQTVH